MKKYKLTLTLRGEATITLPAEDESEAVVEAEDLFFHKVFSLKVKSGSRTRSAALEIQDVDIDEVEET